MTNLTDEEILERLREHFQTKVENLSGDEMAEGPFEDGTEDGELWEQAASRIDARGGLRIRFEFGDTEIEWGYRYRGEPDHFMRIVSSEETAREYVGERENWEIYKRVPAGPWERAVAEARPHDDEHAVDCQGCDGPGVVPCAADEVVGGFAMRDGEPIKDLRGGDRG